MDLKALKNSFFNYLKKFDQDEVFILMNYLSFLSETFSNDYFRFKGTFESPINLTKLH